MSFEKKVVVLKQLEDGYSATGKPISGIVRIETEDGVSTLFLSPVNFAAKPFGEYFLFVFDSEKNVFRFSLGKKPYSLTTVLDESTDVSRGFAAGICYLNADIPAVAAYQRSEGFSCSVSEFRKIVADKCIEYRKQRLKEEEQPTTINARKAQQPERTSEEKRKTPAVPAEPERGGGKNNPSAACEATYERKTPPEYDDEAVATENFYELDEEIKLKTELLEKAENERLRNETVTCDSRKQETPSQNENDFEIFGNETDSFRCENHSPEHPFFASVKDEIVSLFDKFPEESSLKKTFPDGDFIRINYSSEKFYVVGVIKERGKEKYVCYGVPATYSETPPKELDGYCTFIPVSVFDMKGDGYWMMFQDAITGECIKPH